MLRFSGPHTPKWLMAYAGAEGVILIASFYVGLSLSWVDFSLLEDDFLAELPRALLFSGVLLATMLSVGLYNREHFTKLTEALIRIGVAFFLGFLILTAIFFSAPILAVWRSVTLIALLIGYVGIASARYFASRLVNSELLKSRVVVYGTGNFAARLEALEQSERATGFVCVGFIANGDEAVKVSRARLIPQPNYALAELVAQERVGQIVVAVDNEHNSLPTSALMECKAKGVKVVDFLTFFAAETGRIDMDALKPDWVLFARGGLWSRLYLHLKRAIDICASFVVLICQLPLSVLVAIAILLEDGGPVIYRQRRVGCRGREFTLLKFRSMKVSAEDGGAPSWTTENDPRVTRVGAFLRRSRLDELPQLFNVLKGDMSLVGPRPEQAYFVDQLSNRIAYYADRHWAKPGITGWAQLNYGYSASVQGARTKLQYDLYYVAYCSLFLDMLIILQTIKVVIWPFDVR